MKKEKKRYLVLADGKIFEGRAFGADAAGSIGELVFTTNMNGYIETLTDPSYYGQIIMQTFPMIGNYGVNGEDAEGKCVPRGYVVREWCGTPSNFRAEEDVDAFLKKNDVPGICGVDTRELTKIIRETGVMNALITDEIPDDISLVEKYSVTNAVNSVTCRKSDYFAAENKKFSVVLIDYGAKRNIVRELLARGCDVTCVPCGITATEILALSPDGVMLSNGPGDPSENVECIAQIAVLFGKVPMFGICLGHQMLALACGGKTIKMKYGHRGANQPVRDIFGIRTYITSQNHGYEVLPETLETGNVRYVNANDGSCEGIDYPSSYAFSVQFHPEACSGPHDTSFIFDRFTELMKLFKNGKEMQ